MLRFVKTQETLRGQTQAERSLMQVALHRQSQVVEPSCLAGQTWKTKVNKIMMMKFKSQYL